MALEWMKNNQNKLENYTEIWFFTHCQCFMINQIQIVCSQTTVKCNKIMLSNSSDGSDSSVLLLPLSFGSFLLITFGTCLYSFCALFLSFYSSYNS